MRPIPTTDGEWATLISEVEETVQEQQEQCPLPTPDQLPGYFDHTLLKLDATEEGIGKLCTEAKEYGFKVCDLLICLGR